MGFQLVPKSMTLNDLERRNDRYLAFFAEFRSFTGRLHQSGRRWTYTVCDGNVVQTILFLARYHLWQYSQRLLRTSALFIGTCMRGIHRIHPLPDYDASESQSMISI